ncbi:hypothetical protein AB0E08_03685 [Streptomyces sp. NPDC048281]|uniref:hypothetical protein n=1 Tax=Streptomyces sp. NPDC048281 TaxID=3154715 RepID=UPI0034408A54
MRVVIAVLVTAIITAGFSVGITYQAMESRVFTSKVDAFNDGFLDGACRNGMDGFGHICR